MYRAFKIAHARNLFYWEHLEQYLNEIRLDLSMNKTSSAYNIMFYCISINQLHDDLTELISSNIFIHVAIPVST